MKNKLDVKGHPQRIQKPMGNKNLFNKFHS